MAGKLSKDMRVYFGTYDFSTATTQVSVNLESLPLDPTVFTDAALRATAGNRQDSFEWVGLFNDGTSVDAAGSALIGSATNNVLSVLVGTTTGDRAYAGTGRLLAAKPAARLGELVRQEVAIRPDQALSVGIHYGSATGSFTAEKSSGSHDNSTLTTAGGAFYTHILSAAGIVGTLISRLADSATGTTFSIISSTEVTGVTGATSLKSTISGTIQRYTRHDIVGTGTVSFISILARS